MSLDPTSLTADVEKGAASLEKAADSYSKAVLRAERAENAYEREFQKKLLVVYHKAKESGERTPAEDLRRAMAHELIDSEVYAEHLESKALKEAMAVKFRALQSAVSARQSLLKVLSGVGG